MPYPAGLQENLQLALEEALQDPRLQATLERAGVDTSQPIDVTVSHPALGTEVLEVAPAEDAPA